MSLEHLNWEDDSDVTNVTPNSLNSETPSSDNLTPTSNSPRFRSQSRMSRADMGKRCRREMNSSPSDYESSPPPLVYANDGTPRVRIRARELPHRPITPTIEAEIPPLYRQYYVQCGDCACSLEGRLIHEYVSDHNN